MNQQQQPMMSLEEYQRRQDTDQLNLIRIGYYVVGALMALTCSIALIHFSLGLAMLNGNLPPSKDMPPVDKMMGWIFTLVGGFVVLFGWITGGLTIYAGKCIGERKKKTLIQVMAGLSCLHMPLGTILGVFTFILLGRPSIQALFEGRDPYSEPTNPTEGNWYCGQGGN